MQLSFIENKVPRVSSFEYDHIIYCKILLQVEINLI